jgi:hypothetical protein
MVLAAAHAAWVLPLRIPVLVVTFLALTLENPGDVPAAGLWRSPLYTFGALMMAHLNVTLPRHRSLLFSGLDVVLLLLGAIAVRRRLAHSPVDGDGHVPAAAPMRLFAAMTLAGAAWMWLYGMSRGGADVASSLWQVQRVAYLPVVFWLAQGALRGPADLPVLGAVLIGAASVRAAMALFVYATVPVPAGQVLPYATTHADSMLFAGSFAAIVVALIEGYGRRRALVATLVLPLITMAMVVNNRRIAWVELAWALVVVILSTRRTRLKRSLLRTAIVGSPLILAYVVAGWGSSAAVFRPLGIFRSVADSGVDASTGWRDWENYDLFYTLRQHPLLGTGYGHPFTEIAKLPDISSVYSLYAFIPHNSILGLWAYGGLVGFALQWTMLAVGLLLAARANRRAKYAVNRVAALVSIAIIVTYSVHCWGDMGLGTWTSVFTVGPALAIAAQTAVATGAWPLRLRVPETWEGVS